MGEVGHPQVREAGVGLVALVAEGGGEPYSGDVFVFRSKRSGCLKLLVFDGSGLVLATNYLTSYCSSFSWK